MARVKGGLGAKKRHNRTLKLAKGYRGARSKQYRVAKHLQAHTLDVKRERDSSVSYGLLVSTQQLVSTDFHTASSCTA